MTGVTAATRGRRFAGRPGVTTGRPPRAGGNERSGANPTRRPDDCCQRSRHRRGLSQVDPRDRGSATIWVLACATLLLLLGLVVATRAAAALTRHEAETAADLAALAGASRIGYLGDVAGICGAAEAIVKANGGLLLACSASLQPDGLVGTVSVRAAVSARLPVVGGVRATASARAARLRPSSGTTSTRARAMIRRPRPAGRAPPARGD
jgi:secretion/DNA translocation related TadE-like protein